MLIFWTQGLTSYPALRQQPPGRHHRRPDHQGQAVLLRQLRVQPHRPGSRSELAIVRAHRRRLQPRSQPIRKSARPISASCRNMSAPPPSPTRAAVTVGAATIPIGSVAFVGPNYNNSYNAVAALDYNMSEKDQSAAAGSTTTLAASTPCRCCPRSLCRSRTTPTCFRCRNSTASAHPAERISRILQPQFSAGPRWRRRPSRAECLPRSRSR